MPENILLFVHDTAQNKENEGKFKKKKENWNSRSESS